MGSVELPPDGGYGWVVVGAVAANNAHHWGIVSVSLEFAEKLQKANDYISAMESSSLTSFHILSSRMDPVLTMLLLEGCLHLKPF